MDTFKDAPNENPLRYRCFALMRPNGGWSRWRFAPDRGQTYKQLLHNAGRDVLFASVQHFPPPLGMAGLLKWGEVGEQYKNEKALPHIAPLYFDIDCADGLDDALTLAHGLYEFFTGELDVASAHVRVWFSGSKGAHLLVHPEALGIKPSPTLTLDMRPIALGLCDRLAREYGVPDLSADDKVYSLPRMLRCENQMNLRSGLYKVRLTPEELATCDGEFIKELAVSPRTALEDESLPAAIPVSETAKAWWAEQIRHTQSSREFRKQSARVAGVKLRPDGFAEDELHTDNMPACMSALMSNHSPQGTRNRSEMQIACWARAAGRNESDAVKLLARWIAHNRPELPGSQAHRRAIGIVRAAIAGRYGFSCAASRAALRSTGLSADCANCKAVRFKHPQLVSSVRIAESDLLPETCISLEDARERTRTLALAACA